MVVVLVRHQQKKKTTKFTLHANLMQFLRHGGTLFLVHSFLFSPSLNIVYHLVFHSVVLSPSISTCCVSIFQCTESGNFLPKGVANIKLTLLLREEKEEHKIYFTICARFRVYLTLLSNRNNLLCYYLEGGKLCKV